MFKMKRKCAVPVLVAAIVCLAAPVHADLVNFAFCDSAQPDPNDVGLVGVLGGGYWNLGGGEKPMVIPLA